MQFGVHAALSRRRPRVQIPSGPPGAGAAASVSQGRVAQSAEHAPEKRGVTGSTPVPATPKPPAPGRGLRRVARLGRRSFRRPTRTSCATPARHGVAPARATTGRRTTCRRRYGCNRVTSASCTPRSRRRRSRRRSTSWTATRRRATTRVRRRRSRPRRPEHLRHSTSLASSTCSRNFRISDALNRR